MTMPANEAVDNARSEPRTRAELVLEGIALRHQIAVLRRCGTRRACFRRWDRLFWILPSWWWPALRESLLIVQPETVLRWRRNGWSAFWRYRSRGRWRGGRPKVSRVVRGLIAKMARENFLWGAPRIHGEPLMLGFTLTRCTRSARRAEFRGLQFGIQIHVRSSSRSCDLLPPVTHTLLVSRHAASAR